MIEYYLVKIITRLLQLNLTTAREIEIWLYEMLILWYQKFELCIKTGVLLYLSLTIIDKEFLINTKR